MKNCSINHNFDNNLSKLNPFSKYIQVKDFFFWYFNVWKLHKITYIQYLKINKINKITLYEFILASI